MNNFNHIISEKIVDFNGQSIRVISIRIVFTSSKFPVRAANLTIKVTDPSGIVVKSWTHRYSGNLKELDAWFTTDAFHNMGNIVKITMVYDLPFLEISNVDISNFINLPPNTDPGVIDADNAWLQNILDNQDT